MKNIKLKSILSEMPYGKNGYFPPMGADSPKGKNNDTEEIYKGNTAMKVATELKKFIDKIQPEFLELGKRVVPFVNYSPSTRDGNLILGFAFVDSNTPATKDDGKYQNSAYNKYKSKLESILKKSKTDIWNGHHNGFNGTYKGESYKSGIVYGIVTPQVQFSGSFAQKLRQLFEK